MDSWKIIHGDVSTTSCTLITANEATELEKRHPTPSLHLDDPIVVKIRDHIDALVEPLRANVVPKVPQSLLNKVSADYFELTREQKFGMPLTQVESELGGEKRWEEVKEPAKETADLLKKNGGPFFLGKTGKPTMINCLMKLTIWECHMPI